MVELDDILDVDQVRPALAAGGFTVTDAAAILSRDAHIMLGRDQLFTVLAGAEWIRREPVKHRWVGTSRALEHGWVVMDTDVIRTGADARERVPIVRVTLDGLKTLREHLAPPDVVPEPTLFD